MSTVFDTIYAVGVNIDGHCFSCTRPDCKGVCEYAHDPKQKSKRKKADAEYIELRKQRRKEQWSERYRLLRDRGICARCNKADAMDGMTLCKSCRDLVNARNAERRALKLMDKTKGVDGK